MKRIIVASIIMAIGATIGTAFAATDFNLSDGNIPVNVNDDGDLNVNGGRLQILEGAFVYERTDGAQSALQIRNSGGQSSFLFNDLDDSKIYQIIYTSDGNFFVLFDVNRSESDLSITTATGNVGIGKIGAAEKLDVNGNIKLNGNIVSDGDICIGAC